MCKELAPGVPDDYYRRIYDAEQAHFWYRGMWGISVALLGDRLHAGLRLLDAGCGTGGYLRFVLDRGSFASVAGADIAAAAIALARERVPQANLRVAPLRELPFAAGSFELVVSNDVLQHVHEAEVHESLLEVRRVLASGGTLLLRTNASRRLRRERDDWRAYDAVTLRRELESAGFSIERLTHANAVLSLAGTARRRVPHAPSENQHGIPTRPPGRLVSTLGSVALSAEAWWIARGRSLPYGHTLFAVAKAPAA
jgi:SAM-dependent methyltransferase